MKLADYLELKKMKPSAFAALIGSPASTVTRILNGQRTPTIDLAGRISRATKGAVTADDFLKSTPAESGAAA